MKLREYGIPVLLSVSGGIISALAWYPLQASMLLLISFLPFFLIAGTTKPGHPRFGNRLVFILVLPGFLAMNITALAWVRISGIPLLITVIAGNSLLMAVTVWLGWLSAQKSRSGTGMFIILYWLAMEYATGRFWILSPWLNLGNGLASMPSIIQWYEYTGVAGGTLWILLSNMMAANLVKQLLYDRDTTGCGLKTMVLAALISVPILLSLLIVPDREAESGETAGVLLLQPCIDPYESKFTTPFSDQLSEVLRMAGEGISDNTAWIITAETTVDDPIDLNNTAASAYIDTIRNFLAGRADIAFILGATTYQSGVPPLLHNSALLVTGEGVTDCYHKSRLVPGIERSFGGRFSLLQKLFPGLGGTAGGFTGQDEAGNMVHPSGSMSAGPAICFESAFGEQLAATVREGAGFIALITNDGWWKGSMGYYQHLSFSSLRAIETRRYVARAANTGVSAIIGPDGRVRESVGWWQKGSLQGQVTAAGRMTFYVRYGSLIYRTATIITIFLGLMFLVTLPLRERYPRSSNASP